MSLENVKAFYEVVKKDQGLQGKIAQMAQTNPKEVEATVIKLAGEKGYQFTLDEVKTFAKNLASTMPTNGELSDSELEAVAGGKGGGAKFQWGVISIVSGGTGCAATAAGSAAGLGCNLNKDPF
jgi:predicted ribosomally synthesized peptide with nif11-like leader